MIQQASKFELDLLSHTYAQKLLMYNLHGGLTKSMTLHSVQDD